MYVSNTKAQLNTQDTEAKYTKKCAYTHVVRSVMQNNGTLSRTKPRRPPGFGSGFTRCWSCLLKGKKGKNAFESKNMFSQIAPFPSLRGALSSAGAASSGKGARTPEWRAHVFGLCCGVIEISHSSRLKMYTNRMVFLVSSSSSVL